MKIVTCSLVKNKKQGLFARKDCVNSHAIEAGFLASGHEPVTVAAQRWTLTILHLYALASGPSGSPQLLIN